MVWCERDTNGSASASIILSPTRVHIGHILPLIPPRISNVFCRKPPRLTLHHLRLLPVTEPNLLPNRHQALCQIIEILPHQRNMWSLGSRYYTIQLHVGMRRYLALRKAAECSHQWRKWVLTMRGRVFFINQGIVSPISNHQSDAHCNERQNWMVRNLSFVLMQR
jgi:hypothetical protein